MEKLHVLFDLDGHSTNNEMVIAPPYDWIVTFIGSEIGHDIRGCEWWLERLGRALAGTPTPELAGNLWELTADASTTTVAHQYDETISYTAPTSIVIEAIERWMAFLEEHGRDVMGQG